MVVLKRKNLTMVSRRRNVELKVYEYHLIELKK